MSKPDCEIVKEVEKAYLARIGVLQNEVIRLKEENGKLNAKIDAVKNLVREWGGDEL